MTRQDVLVALRSAGLHARELPWGAISGGTSVTDDEIAIVRNPFVVVEEDDAFVVLMPGLGQMVERFPVQSVDEIILVVRPWMEPVANVRGLDRLSVPV